MPNYAARRDYLVGKLIDGAKAIRDLFDEVYFGRNPAEAAKDVSAKYQLTRDQKRALGKITSGLIHAKALVESLKERYGVTQKGAFRDKSGLYRKVYGEKPPKDYFSARPRSFAIGFYLPEECFEQTEAGNANRLAFHTAHRLPRKIAGNNPKARSLSFRIKRKKLQQKPPEERLLSALGLSSIDRIEQHELRHVIDNALGNLCNGYTGEFSAELYGGRTETAILTRDATEPLKAAIERHKRLKELNASQFVLDNEQKIIDERKRRVERMEELATMAQDIVKKGLSGRALSYIVTLTDFDKLPHRLRLIKEHLEKYPSER